MKTVTVILTGLALCLSVSAESQTTWESHTRTGEYAFASGNMERAEEEFQAALAIAQKLPPPDPRLETSLWNLARFYEHEERYEQALPMYQLMVAAEEARLGSEDPELLTPLLAVGRVALQTGDIPTAEDSLERYRSIAAATGAADPEELWLALATLARLNTLQERHDDALELQRQAVAALDEAHGPTPLERATGLESLAQMELLYGSPDSAEALLLRAAELRAEDVEGGSVATMLTAGASTALGAGAIDTAEGLAERALVAAEAEGQDPFPITLVLADAAWMRVQRGTDNLADLYLGASSGPELDEAYKRLLEVHAHPDRLDPPAIGENLSRLAQVGALRGEVDDSAHWQRMVVDLERETSGVGSPQTLAAQENLIGLFLAADRTDQALTANVWLIAAQETAWGQSSPRLRPALERQLDLLLRAGLKKDAKGVKKRLKRLP